MIKIENTEVFGFEAAMRGMRNPMNSWNKGDTHGNEVGDNDFGLAMRLAKAGKDHRKFMRMIIVQADILAPRFWWVEEATYKVGTVENSTSTMHRIHAKEFTLDDFSHEHLGDDYSDEYSLVRYNGEYDDTPHEVLEYVVDALNQYREAFLKTKDKKYWRCMIELLPQSYNQLRTVSFNYEVLANMYHARKDHKLQEWHDFCDWIRSLPYSEWITDGE